MLGVNQVHIQLSRMRQSFIDSRFGDFVEDDSLGVLDINMLAMCRRLLLLRGPPSLVPELSRSL